MQNNKIMLNNVVNFIAELDEKIFNKALERKRKILITEAWDERALSAAFEVHSEGIAEIILLGPKEKILYQAEKLKLDLSSMKIIDPKTYNPDDKNRLAERLSQLRSHKGLTKEEAVKLLENDNYFGCMLVYSGAVDAIAGSCICPTGNLIRPALQILTKKDTETTNEVQINTKNLVSEIVAVPCQKLGRVLFLTDISMNVDPTAKELAQIAINAVDGAQGLGYNARCALLSYSTKGSGGSSSEIEKIKEAVKIAQNVKPGYIIDGEYQLDAAINPSAAQKKCPENIIKGDANILVFSNLTASNIFLHGISQLADLEFRYRFLIGIEKPVTIFGRSNSINGMKNLLIGCAAQCNFN